MLGLPAIKLAGDTATARTFCFNPMVLKGEKPKVMQVGVWYDDEFVRTAAGWRLSPPRRDQVLRQDPVTSAAEPRFLPVGAVLAQWAAVCRATTAPRWSHT